LLATCRGGYFAGKSAAIVNAVRAVSAVMIGFADTWGSS
jgi:hypothetical protein